MPEPLDNRELRALKSKAQLLKPMVKLGKDGMSPAFVKSLDDALTHNELVKVKFDEFKDQKKEMMPQLAEKVSAHIILRVGNVLVLFRRKPTPATSAPP